MPAGLYSVTASATDTQGNSATSSAITIKISKALKALRNTRKNASAIEDTVTSSSANMAVQANEIDSIIFELVQTYFDFHSERAMFESAKRIENYLFAALYLARVSSSLAKQPSGNDAVADRMNKLDVYLRFCEDLMVQNRISGATLIAADQVKANVNLTIFQPEVRSQIGSELISPAGVAMITATSGNRFTTLTQSGNSYELGQISVMVKGQAAEVLSISPTTITFRVPDTVPSGLVDIAVTSRDGYLSYSTAAVFGLNPKIFLSAGSSDLGAIVDALNVHNGSFSTMTPAQVFGLDTRTRLSILATGITSGVGNTDSSNDIWLANGQMLANLAESVVVQARTSTGTTINLPVEYAGMQGTLAGLDQVNVILPREIAGAGSVEVTLVVRGVRSNPITLTVQ
jgi:uncharacterized protein (TIGR03437 family)